MDDNPNISMIGGGTIALISGPDKKAKKCLLPGCSKMTTHNGGYCSADHKRLSKVAR